MMKGVEAMKVPFNDLKRGWLCNNTDVGEALTEVWKSGHYILGLNHERFQNELASYLGVNFVIGVASGTDALVIGLLSLGVTRKSKIISVANAGGYTSIASSQIGCEVLYCDVAETTHLMDLEYLKSMPLEEVQVVVVTHLYGNAASVIEIVDYCRSRGVKVLEDCAQSLGGNFSDGKFLGTIGDVGVTSFYPTKNLGAMGDGGAIFTNSEKFALLAQSLSQYGWAGKYDIAIPGGMNSRLDELQAAVLRIGLRNLDERNATRRNVVLSYANILNPLGIRVVTSGNGNQNSAHLAVIELPEKLNREKAMSALLDMGVSTAIHYPILDTKQRGLGVKELQLPVSERLNSKIISLPCFDGITNQEIQYTCKMLAEVLKSA